MCLPDRAVTFSPRLQWIQPLGLGTGQAWSGVLNTSLIVASGHKRQWLKECEEWFRALVNGKQAAHEERSENRGNTDYRRSQDGNRELNQWIEQNLTNWRRSVGMKYHACGRVNARESYGA
jgi:hypothetical protein